MKILIVTAGYSIFDAKGQLNSYLAYRAEQNLLAKEHEVRNSDVTKDRWNVEKEVEKLLWAETIIYILPIMWFNMPAPLVKWFDEVLLYGKTFIITENYGEGGLVSADKFMIAVTSNLERDDLGHGYVLKKARHIDDVLQPLIMTNNYLSIRNQIPTFHADNVIAGDTDWIKSAWGKHLNQYFSHA